MDEDRPIIQNSENPVRSTQCKICASSGFTVYIFFRKEGLKEDGSPRWIPYDDEKCTKRHVHRIVNQIDTLGPLIAKIYDVVLNIEQHLIGTPNEPPDESAIY